MISKKLVVSALAATAALMFAAGDSLAMAVTDVALDESAVGGAPVAPIHLSTGNAVNAGDTAAPLPEPVDPGSVILPGFLSSIGGAIQFTEEPGAPVAGFYSSNFALAPSEGAFGERRFFSVSDQTQFRFLAEPSFSIGASPETSAFGVSLFQVDGPSGAVGPTDDSIPATMDVTEVALDTATTVTSLIDGVSFMSPDLVFGTAVLNPGTYFLDILAETDASNAGYKLELQYIAPVPLPAGVWLFLSGIAGLICISRFRRSAA